MLFFYDYISFCFVKRSVPFTSRLLVNWIVHEVGRTLSCIADHQERVSTEFASLLLHRGHEIVPLFLCPPSFDDCDLGTAYRFSVKHGKVAVGSFRRSIEWRELSNGHLGRRLWIYLATGTNHCCQDQYSQGTVVKRIKHRVLTGSN